MMYKAKRGGNQGKSFKPKGQYNDKIRDEYSEDVSGYHKTGGED